MPIFMGFIVTVVDITTWKVSEQGESLFSFHGDFNWKEVLT